MKSRIFLKLYLAALLVIAACTFTMAVLIRHAWVGMLRSEIETSLRQKTLMFASRVEEAPPASLSQITQQAAAAADTRITVIDSAGKVLADSEANPDRDGEPCFPAGICRRIAWPSGKLHAPEPHRRSGVSCT